MRYEYFGKIGGNIVSGFLSAANEHVIGAAQSLMIARSGPNQKWELWFIRHESGRIVFNG